MRNGVGEEKGQGRGLAYGKCTPVKRGKSGVGVQKEWSWGGKRARCRPDLRKMHAGEERQERSRRAKEWRWGGKRDKAEAWPTKNARR